MALILAFITSPIHLIHPQTYNDKWFRAYLSQKYGIDAHPDVFEKSPYPIPVVKNQPTPAGLVFKYLMFGERAVDYGSMID
ncbi:MAG: hypothetical protein QME64_10495 [bacterium]|nr:hypothetical protein [bacterium]